LKGNKQRESKAKKEGNRPGEKMFEQLRDRRASTNCRSRGYRERPKKRGGDLSMKKKNVTKVLENRKERKKKLQRRAEKKKAGIEPGNEKKKPAWIRKFLVTGPYWEKK